MAIKIDNATVKAAYLGTSKVKHIYMDNKLVFSDTINLTLTLDTGVSSVTITATRVDGLVTSASYSASTTIGYAYGSTLSISASAKTGYTMNSYTSVITMLKSETLSYVTTINKFWTDVNLNYNGVQYGGANGDKIGTFYYSTNNSVYYGPYSNEPWTGDTKFAYDSYLYLRSIVAAPGFYLSSVSYNGQTIGNSGGTYPIKIGNGSYNVDVNYSATTNSSSSSFGYATSIASNSLSRNAFNVSCSINIQVGACAAGTVIGTVPYQYRPSSAKSFNTEWRVQTGTSTSTSTATITINTDGSIVSNTASDGAGNQSGGGKWGSFSIAWTTKMVISGSWSVI